MIWVLLASIANAQWYETKIQGDANGIAVVGAAVRQWRPTDEVFFTIEERLTNTITNNHSVKLQRWECLNNPCSSVSLLQGQLLLNNTLRYDQYAHPAMAIKRDLPSTNREVNVAMRGRFNEICDSSGAYSISLAHENVTKYLDVVNRVWNTSFGLTSQGAIRAEYGDNVCENATRSFAKFDEFQDVNVAYDWEETPDVSSGPGFVPIDVFVTVEEGSDTIAQRNTGELGSRFAPTFDFFNDDNGDESRAVAFYDTVKETTVDFIDYSGVVDVSFDKGDADIWHPSIEVVNDRIHLVLADETEIDYRTCKRSSDSDCNDSADWTHEVLSNDADEASIVADGKRLFVVFSEDDEVKVASKCFGATSWNIETPRAPGTNAQMLYSGRPYAVVNKGDNVLHVVLVENTSGELNEDDGEAWWLRRTYTDCP